MLTDEELKCLRRLIARAEHAAPSPPSSDFQELAPGDVVQIRPSADRTFGGMLAAVTKAEPYELRAYALRPHRGGCAEAWLKLNHCDVERIGRMLWPPESRFALRRWCADPTRCPRGGR
jgi:hypothetical protein